MESIDWSLQRRITELENANASLWSGQEALTELLTISQNKIFFFEKQVELLTNGNIALNNIVTEIRKELEQVASQVHFQKGLNRDDSPNISHETQDAVMLISDKTTSSAGIEEFKTSDLSRELHQDEERPLKYLIVSQARKVSNSPSDPFKAQSILSPDLDSSGRIAIGDNPRRNTIVPSESSTRAKPKGKFTPQKPFENFVVIGATKENVSRYLNAGSNKSIDNFDNEQPKSIEGSILFNYAERQGLSSNLTPIGIEKIIASRELLLKNYSLDSKKAKDNFYKVVLKSQKKYKKRFICPFKPHTDYILLSDWADYPETINPQNKLYAFCIQKSDYVIITEESIGKEHFVVMETIYCLFTYYPIPQLCFNLLVSVLNLVRKRRKEVFWGRYPQDRSRSDFSFLDTIFMNEVTHYLNGLSQLAYPSPNLTINYNFNDDKSDQAISAQFTCPSENNACFELASWGAYNTFSKFSLKDISLILSSMLLDKTVVFFSSDVTNLTATLNTFLGILYPLKFNYKIAPLMTAEMLYLFDNIQPIILCLNRKENYFLKKDLAKFPHLFVFLDSKTIFIHEHNKEILDAPTLDFLTKEQKDVYKKLNKGSKFEVINKLSALKRKIDTTSQGEVSENDNIDFESVQPEKMRKSVDILAAFRKKIDSDILRGIRPFEGHNPINVNAADMDRTIDMLMQSEGARKFFYEFKKTITFINYPQTANLVFERQYQNGRIPFN